jgi:hypothetical protein
MSELMDLLRGPALGVVFMIILLAGALLITAFAALMAQMGLLFRMKPWNTSETFPKNQGSETGSGTRQPGFYGHHVSAQGKQPTSTAERTRSPQMVVHEPDANEVVDAVWREAR